MHCAARSLPPGLLLLLMLRPVSRSRTVFSRELGRHVPGPAANTLTTVWAAVLVPLPGGEGVEHSQARPVRAWRTFLGAAPCIRVPLATRPRSRTAEFRSL